MLHKWTLVLILLSCAVFAIISHYYLFIWLPNNAPWSWQSYYAWEMLQGVAKDTNKNPESVVIESPPGRFLIPMNRL